MENMAVGSRSYLAYQLLKLPIITYIYEAYSTCILSPCFTHYLQKSFRLNLDLYKAGDIMSSPVITVQMRESVSVLSTLILNTTHGGFPVISKTPDGRESFFGIITRYKCTPASPRHHYQAKMYPSLRHHLQAKLYLSPVHYQPVNIYPFARHHYQVKIYLSLRHHYQVKIYLSLRHH